MSVKNEDFAFTLKFNEKDKKNCIPSDYDYIFVLWQERGIEVVTKRYERDSRGVCHVHGIISAPPKFYWRQLGKLLKGLAWKIDPITDRQGWIRYINKQNNQISPVRMFVVNSDIVSSDSEIEDATNDVIRKLKSPLWCK